MPINTVVAGDPDAVAAAGAWLRGRLAATLHEATGTIAQARSTTSNTWTGPASEAFGARTEHIRRGIDDLTAETTRVANSFGTFADALREAQTRMGRARDIATTAGLTITNGVIAEPGPPPMCFLDPELDAAVRLRSRQMHDAYQAARTEARCAFDILVDNGVTAARIWNEATKKWFLTAPEFVGKAAKSLVDKHVTALDAEADRFRDQSVTAQQRALEARGGPDAALHESIRDETSTQAADLRDKAGKAKLSPFGLAAFDKGITIGAIALDISQGKPPAKAIVTNTAGSLGGGFIGRAIDTALTARGAGAAGVALAAGATGVLVGVAVGLAAEAVWDDLPPVVKDKIEQGVKEVFEAGQHAIADVWHGAENIAEKVWNFIF